MRRIAVALLLVGLAAPLGAQERGRGRGRDVGRGDSVQGVPPGHLPPPGECRVWYDRLPPGQQPPPTSCAEAQRVASRDPYARVIYGGDRGDGRWRRDDDDRNDGRDEPIAVPRRVPGYPLPVPYPERYPRSEDGNASPAFDNGYRDGYEAGREDRADNDDYDPVRHSRYRSADRGYDDDDGSREFYRNVYRDGFRAGYEDGYRG